MKGKIGCQSILTDAWFILTENSVLNIDNDIYTEAIY
jgi:hypothetical protein